jgi:hypothetical protein
MKLPKNGISLLAGLGLCITPITAFAPILSPPPMLSAEQHGSDITITITGTARISYTIQATSALGANDNWTTIASNLVAGVGGVYIFMDTNTISNFPNRFYRASYSP